MDDFKVDVDGCSPRKLPLMEGPAARRRLANPAGGFGRYRSFVGRGPSRWVYTDAVYWSRRFWPQPALSASTRLTFTAKPCVVTEMTVIANVSAMFPGKLVPCSGVARTMGTVANGTAKFTVNLTVPFVPLS